MNGVQPSSETPRPAGHNNLLLRIVSSLVLAPLAIAAAYLGGLPFLAFWAVAALLVLWEWDTLVYTDSRNAVLAMGVVVLVGTALLLALDRVGIAAALIALGALGLAGLSFASRPAWCVAGLGYAALLLIAPVLLRRDVELGFASIIYLFVIVWLTDIAAYFTGRAFGGPKLMPRVSPNKTWSGAIGGTVAAIVGGVIVARQAGAPTLAAAGAVAVVLSVVSQAGDLVESAIKRHFNAKDASQLIPGHGGLMDRLDGFIAAVAFAAALAAARSSGVWIAPGLFQW